MELLTANIGNAAIILLILVSVVSLILVPVFLVVKSKNRKHEKQLIQVYDLESEYADKVELFAYKFTFERMSVYCRDRRRVLNGDDKPIEEESFKCGYGGPGPEGRKACKFNECPIMRQARITSAPRTFHPGQNARSAK